MPGLTKSIRDRRERQQKVDLRRSDRIVAEELKSQGYISPATPSKHTLKKTLRKEPRITAENQRSQPVLERVSQLKSVCLALKKRLRD